MCEKPLCIKKEDITKILEAEKNSEAMLGVCLQNRYNPANIFVKEYIKDKEVQGGVGQVSWNRDEKYYIAISFMHILYIISAFIDNFTSLS